MGADQVVESMPGDREDGLPVALGVIKAIQQMDASGAGRRETHAEPARVLRISAGCECSRLLVTDLNEADLVLRFAQGLEYSVYAIAGEPEDGIDPPINKTVNQYFRYRFRHWCSFFCCCPLPRRGRLR
jgi:hypothetical protein